MPEQGTDKPPDPLQTVVFVAMEECSKFWHDHQAEVEGIVAAIKIADEVLRSPPQRSLADQLVNNSAFARTHKEYRTRLERWRGIFTDFLQTGLTAEAGNSRREGASKKPDRLTEPLEHVFYAAGLCRRFWQDNQVKIERIIHLLDNANAVLTSPPKESLAYKVANDADFAANRTEYWTKLLIWRRMFGDFLETGRRVETDHSRRQGPIRDVQVPPTGPAPGPQTRGPHKM